MVENGSRFRRWDFMVAVSPDLEFVNYSCVLPRSATSVNLLSHSFLAYSTVDSADFVTQLQFSGKDCLSFVFEASLQCSMNLVCLNA